MPGLIQLQKFNQTITVLGHEPERRKEKGESLPQLKMPTGIKNEEDFDDFMFGLPTGNEDSDTLANSAPESTEDENTESIDIDQLIAGLSAQNSSEPAEPQEQPQDSSDFSLPGIDNSIDLSSFGDFGDFSSTTEDSNTEPVAETQDFSLDELLPPETNAQTETTNNELDDAETLDLLDDFDLTPTEAENTASNQEAQEEFLDLTENFEEDFSPVEDLTPAEENFENLSTSEVDFVEDLTPELEAEPATTDENFAPSASSGEMDFSLPDLDFTEPSDSTETISDLDDFSTPVEDFTPETDEAETSEMDFSIPEFDESIGNLQTEEPDGTQSSDFDLTNIDFDVPTPENSTESDNSELDLPSIDFDDNSTTEQSQDSEIDFSLPDFDETEPANDSAASATDDSLDLSLDDFSADFGDSGDTGDFTTTEATEDGSTADDFSMPDFGEAESTEASNPMDVGFDSLPSDAFDVEPETDTASGTFENTDEENEFSIVGFTDGTEPAELDIDADKKKQAFGGKKNAQPTNELTEQEYETFNENLIYYPLNVRLAIEEMIVKNELTDDIIMKVIRKVIKRVPARQLANNLEKILDITLSVPINYEKRTAAEYEAYRKSFEYRLKNQILPFLAVSAVTIVSCIIIGVLATKFIVRPVKAQMLYKEGYALIQNELYPQSEDKFIEATSYNRNKNWYFKYARSYAEHKQFQRARDTYTRLLYDYKHDKAAGLEFVKMELYDLSNYQGAEDLLRREVLDYHTNDPDALLLLGDIYLEWASNKDSSMFEPARAEYASLMAKYGQQPIYLSRMMRYFIRTDDLKEVLTLKEYFFPKIKNKILEPNDLIELSEYMLEKQHGTLAPKEEYLRTYIEDVRSMLEQAVIQAPESPEAMYNYGKYFVYTNSDTNAQTVMQEALSMFKNSPTKNHKRIQKHIDTNRILGEISYKKEDYLKAESYFIDGLELFESETVKSGLKSNSNVGKMYEDLANIDYFISGDKEAALNNYKKATQNFNDTPSINYRIGYLHYSNNDYSDALNAFAKTIDENPSDKNALLALGNTLMQRNSISSAAGYYEKLIEALNVERNRADILYPQVNAEDASLVEQYMKVANNLGVSFVKRSEQTGNSSYIAKAMANFEESIRAFDALTRNQQTMIRLGGSNLAAFNQRYLTYPDSTYESAIYTSISPVLEKEAIPEQSVVK